jgi:hypothetical protein
METCESSEILYSPTKLYNIIIRNITCKMLSSWKSSRKVLLFILSLPCPAPAIKVSLRERATSFAFHARTAYIWQCIEVMWLSIWKFWWIYKFAATLNTKIFSIRECFYGEEFWTLDIGRFAPFQRPWIRNSYFESHLYVSFCSDGPVATGWTLIWTWVLFGVQQFVHRKLGRGKHERCAQKYWVYGLCPSSGFF